MINEFGYCEEDRCSTDDEAMQEYARNAGEEFADRQWLLTSYDVWVRNPRYVGPPQRHPEDYDDSDFE